MPLQFDTYTDLIESVTELLARQDAKPLVPGWILGVEKDLRMGLVNVRDNEAQTAALPFVTDQNFVDMPDDAIRPRMLEIQTDPLRIVDVVDLRQLTKIENEQSGLTFPVAMTMIGSKRIKLAPTPTAANDYILFYWKKEEDVDEDKAPTSVLEEAPLLLYYGAAIHGAIWARDFDSKMLYEQEYEKHRRNYQKHLTRVKFGGGRPRVQPDRQPDDRHRLFGR